MPDTEFFQLRSGRMILDEDLSSKMFLIKEHHPETVDETSSGFERNEIGMASLFAILYDAEARYCPERKSWFTYKDGRWVQDEGSILVAEKLKDFVRLMTLYCGEITDDDVRKGYMSFVAKLGDRRMRDRIMRDAEGELTIPASKFDANPYLINCINGTYDLKNFEFRPHRWDDFLTMQTGFSHTVRQDTSCERWERFVLEVTQNDAEKADYIQRALGYSLLGVANEECMFILHGKTTRNGKSTLLYVIKTLLGDYAAVAPVSMICRSDQNNHAESATPQLVALKGKRFVTMSESNESGVLDEEKIKQYTGGEEVTGRALYQAPITFLPQFTLWLSCNDLPAVYDKSLFSSNRLRLTEFNRHFAPHEQDINLKTELTTQDAMSGIFNWLVRGYAKYRREGLKMPDSLKEAVVKYEADNDIVLQFLSARCEKDNDSRLKAKDLYNTFKLWCKSEGYNKVMSARKFNSEMERHPDWYQKKYSSSGYTVYSGVKFKEVIG